MNDTIDLQTKTKTMTTNQRFLKEAREDANENWLSAAGEEDWGADGDDDYPADGEDWGADGDEYYADDSQWGASGDEWGAAGDQVGQGALSTPYVIRLVNACTTAIANVDIGDANVNQYASNQGANANITITSNIAGTTYIGFLGQTVQKPFLVGKTRIISATAAQLTETVVMTHTDANGDTLGFNLDFTVDENQQQTDRIINYRQFRFDGYTRLRFSNIAASATVTVQIYPLQVFSPTAAVSGGNPVRTFTPPRAVVPVVMSRGGLPKRGRGRGRMNPRRRRLGR